LIDSEVRAASVRGDEVALSITELARGVLYNGLSRYDRVMDIARWAKEEDELTLMHLVLPELLEAAVRTGDRATASSALDRLSSKTQAMGTEWALGVEARCRALLSEREEGEKLYLGGGCARPPRGALRQGVGRPQGRRRGRSAPSVPWRDPRAPGNRRASRANHRRAGRAARAA
jgi:hypothetical protein